MLKDKTACGRRNRSGDTTESSCQTNDKVVINLATCKDLHVSKFRSILYIGHIDLKSILEPCVMLLTATHHPQSAQLLMLSVHTHYSLKQKCRSFTIALYLGGNNIIHRKLRNSSEQHCHWRCNIIIWKHWYLHPDNLCFSHLIVTTSSTCTQSANRNAKNKSAGTLSVLLYKWQRTKPVFLI